MVKKLRLDLFLIGLLLCFFLNSNSLLAWSPTLLPTPTILRGVNYQANQATSPLIHLASQAYGRGNFSEAIRYAEDAITMIRGYSPPSSQLNLARALTLQAQAYNALGQFDVAIPKLTEAITLAQEHRGWELETVALGILGNSYTLSGNYDRALEVYQLSFDLAQTLQQDDLTVTALNNLSSTLAKRSQNYAGMATSALAEGNQAEEERLSELAQKDLLNAEAFALAAVEEYEAEGTVALQALLNLLGLLQQFSSLSLTQFDHYRTQALDLSADLPDSRAKVDALLNLATLSQGTETINILKAALMAAQSVRDRRSETFALEALGKAYLERNEYELASQFTNQAIMIAQEAFINDSLYRALAQAGQIQLAQGNTEAAIGFYQQALEALQDIRKDLVAADRDLQLDLKAEVEPIYREYLALLLEQNQPQQLTKALTVVDSLKLTELQDFFGDTCSEIQQILAQPQNVLEQTQAAVITSLILEKQTYLILQLPDGSVQSFSVGFPALELQAKIKHWRFELEDLATNRYLNTSQELYQLLIKPLEATLALAQPNTLVFVNDGILRNVPMAALYDGQQFLIQKYPIALSLGLDFLTQSPSDSELEALAFGLSMSIPPFAALPYVEAETEAVKEIVGGKDFLNENFTLAQLENQVKKDYSILHLATHGQFGGSASNTFLQAFHEQISLSKLETSLRLSSQPIQLLTLSACQTAAGNERSTLGFAGVALRSQVESVLGSLWFVSDGDTTPLITEFYQSWQGGLSKAEALRNAQLELIKSQAHPSLWSPFILVGNWL